MDIALFGTVGIVVKTKNLSDLIHQSTGFRCKSNVHNASFWCNQLSSKRTRFTPLINQYTRPWTQVYKKINASFKGRLIIRGGRATVRTVLYMAMLTSIQHNPVIRSFYERLVKMGKHKKVALTACIRKMITILNAMVRDGLSWKETAAA